MIEENYKMAQTKLLNIFIKLIAIFKRLSINYYVVGGVLKNINENNTFWRKDCLDIDICMSVEEYSILKNNTHLLPNTVFLQSKETDKLYDSPYIKIKDKNSCIFCEEYRQYHTGIYIDIFLYNRFFNSLLDVIHNKTLRYDDVFPLRKKRVTGLIINIPRKPSIVLKIYPSVSETSNHYTKHGDLDPNNTSLRVKSLYPQFYKSKK